MNLSLTAELFGIGFVAGVLGTLVGLGGAFITIPVLRLLFGLSPAATAGISLFMVLANGISGSFAYLRQGRADIQMALVAAATAIPFSIVGTLIVTRTPSAAFDVCYGAMLVFFFFNIMRRRNKPLSELAPAHARVGGSRQRILIDNLGKTFSYYFNAPLVLALGIVIGFATTFFGIGGGVIFTSVSLAFLRVPVHVATATAIVVMLLTAPVGVVSHVVAGDVYWTFALPLAAGGVIGGQVGPRIAQRLTSPQLLTLLAYVLLFTAITLAIRHFVPR